jgi:hypothetical protein
MTTQTTRRARVLVPLLVAFTSAACASTTAASRQAGGASGRESSPPARLMVQVENESRERIQVYLVGQTRDWFLGRVEAGTHAMLYVPDRSLTMGTMRLAVLAGDQLTSQAARDPRAVLSMDQPTGAIVGQRWVFAQGALMPMRVP